MVRGVQRLAGTGEADPKIISVGLNRCGTTSLHHLFEACGIPSLHWRDDTKRNLTQVMMTNIGLGLKPLDGFHGYRAFTDLSFISIHEVLEGARFFRDLHRAYPDAYFILNTRPVDGWIDSRIQHAGGTFFQMSKRSSGYGNKKIVEVWRDLAVTHETEVMAYFAGNPRFLRFDITRDDPQAIADLLADDYLIDPTLWRQTNRGGGEDAVARVVENEATPG